MIAHPKHEEDDTDLGELWRQVSVGHEARGEWSNSHASKEVPDEGWQAEPVRDETSDKRGAQANGNGGNEFRFVR
jgi:hypothetical protein